MHLRFVAGLYREQMESGRMFLHEHPAAATSWSLAEIQEVGNKKGVHTVVADQCMFGLTTTKKGEARHQRENKTRFMTNSYHIAAALDRRCDGTHQHQALVDGRAQAAARYPPELCRAICCGLRRERQTRAEGISAVAEISSSSGSGRDAPNPEDFHEGLGEAINQISPSPGGGAWDDVTGMPLDRKSVQKA